MDSVSLSWQPGKGWSSALPVHLDSERTLVLAFGPSQLSDGAEAIVDLRRAFPESVCVGTSSGVAKQHGRETALAVSVTRFDQTRLGMVLDQPRRADDEDARVCGRRMADALELESGLSAVLVFADRQSVNRVALMRGLADVLPETIALCDGMDGEAARFHSAADGPPIREARASTSHTWVLAGGAPVEGLAVAVGLYAQRLGGDEQARVGLDQILTAF